MERKAESRERRMNIGHRFFTLFQSALVRLSSRRAVHGVRVHFMSPTSADDKAAFAKACNAVELIATREKLRWQCGTSFTVVSVPRHGQMQCAIGACANALWSSAHRRGCSGSYRDGVRLTDDGFRFRRPHSRRRCCRLQLHRTASGFPHRRCGVRPIIEPHLSKYNATPSHTGMSQ